MGLPTFDFGLSIFGDKLPAVTLEGKLTAGAIEIEGSAFDINGGTMADVTLDGTLTLGSQAFDGDATFNDSLLITDTMAIKAGATGLDADYITFQAHDDDAGDGTWVEVGRISAASEPWFGIGKDSDVVKATYDDKLGFFSTSPIAKPTLGGGDAAHIITALVNLGLVTAAG